MLNNSSSKIAISWMVLASISFGSGSALVKWTAGSVGVWSVVFGRSFVIMLAVAIWSLTSEISLKITNHKKLLWRCSAGMTAMVCYFYSVQQISLSNAVTLQYTSPIFVALFSGVILSEKTSPFIYGCILCSFIGTILIVSPSLEYIEINAVIALFSGIMSAFAYLAVRSLRDSSSPDGVVFWFAVFCTVLSFPLAMLELPTLSFYDFFAVIGVGVCAGIGQAGMTRAYQTARAAYIGAFSYVTVIVGCIYGFLLFDMQIVWGDIFGTALIVISGVILTITPLKSEHEQSL